MIDDKNAFIKLNGITDMDDTVSQIVHFNGIVDAATWLAVNQLTQHMTILTAVKDFTHATLNNDET